MATYNGRGAPNVSQYLRNLNVHDTALEDVIISDEDLQKELAIFTNTQFYDFDSGKNTDYQAHPAKAAAPKPHSAASEETSSPDAYMTDFSNIDFLSSDFNFGEFGSPYTSPTTTSFPDHLSGLQPVQPVSQQGYNGSTVHPHQSGHLGPLVPLATEAKGKAEPSPKNLVVSEEQTRRLAEEDKRRRNTAASARFRIKKKQREQALEKSAKEMMDKVNRLESHISSLETENTWLRRIVMDKYGRDKLPLLLRELRKDSTVEKEDESKNKDASPSSKIGDEGSEMGEDDDEAAEK